MINLKNLSKSYGSKMVLAQINLNLEKGKVYGIVGENGAGKTTLFKCIAGLESYGGDIECKINPLKDVLGFLMTDPFFFTKMTGKEYLQLLCNARKIVLTDFEKQNIFGLPLNQYASTYSTGMKKKLAITGILLQKNEVFILDEPFNGVDIQSNMIITEVIHKLQSLSKTIIISSHIFSTLSDTCDEIILLKEGKIIKHVFKPDFETLDEEMRMFSIGSKIEALELE